MSLLQGKRLARQVFLDVVVFNYEAVPGISSPRRPEDVDTDVLARAIVEGHNARYGEVMTTLEQLLRPAGG